MIPAGCKISHLFISINNCVSVGRPRRDYADGRVVYAGTESAWGAVEAGCAPPETVPERPLGLTMNAFPWKIQRNVHHTCLAASTIALLPQPFLPRNPLAEMENHSIQSATSSCWHSYVDWNVIDYYFCSRIWPSWVKNSHRYWQIVRNCTLYF